MRTGPNTDAMLLRPFWRYYGGKWRAAPRYPAPRYRTIVEPFAGAAGYSLRYPDREVILVDKYPVICEIWRWLIRSKAADVLAIPTVEHVDDLPAWVPEGARYLVGFCMNDASVAPRRQLSAGRKRLAALGNKRQGWTIARRDLVASQVDAIKHWRVIEGDWYQAPHIDATWFVDPPYNNKAGSYYVYGSRCFDYSLLARGCIEAMRGQVIVCENEGATWLPFKPLGTFKAGINNTRGGSREVVYLT